MEALRISNFTFTYAGAAGPALHDVSLDVMEGDFAVIAGATGSGKTTLLQSIKREIAPVGEHSGSISVFGSSVTEANETRDVGFVFQSPDAQIVCDTVWRELAFGLENSGVDPQEMRRRVAEVASLFGIVDWFDAGTSSISGGQKQVLNLASVIVTQPRLLLLDEPVAQLDPISAARLVDTLFHLNREFGMTIIVATHLPEMFASVATESFVIDGGRIERRNPIAHLSNPSNEKEEILEIIQASSAHHDAGGSAALALDDAWFAYGPDAKWVFRGMSIDVREGEIISLVGPNGCGKTTFLKLASGILGLKRGKLDNSLRADQAYVSQNPCLMFMHATVAEELADWAPSEVMDDEDLKRIASEFGLGDVLGRNPLDLSGGQQQMLAIAKAVVAKPRLLFMDEPVKGLDARAKLDVANTLGALRRNGVTCVMATHDLAFAACTSDRIAFIFDGQLASCGTPIEFCEGNAFYRPRPNMFTRLFSESSCVGANTCQSRDSLE